LFGLSFWLAKLRKPNHFFRFPTPLFIWCLYLQSVYSNFLINDVQRETAIPSLSSQIHIICVFCWVYSNFLIAIIATPKTTCFFIFRDHESHTRSTGTSRIIIKFCGGTRWWMLWIDGIEGIAGIQTSNKVGSSSRTLKKDFGKSKKIIEGR
jgi:hypothetical protein